MPTLRVKYNYFYFADRPTIFFFVLPVDQKVNLASPNDHLMLKHQKPTPKLQTPDDLKCLKTLRIDSA